MKLKEKELNKIILAALQEDKAGKDVTSKAVSFNKKETEARIIAREAGVLCGIPVAEKVFEAVSSKTRTAASREDGEAIAKDDTVLKIIGRPADILRAERSALNFLSHLSGIATLTNRYVQAVKKVNSEVSVLDTRKTIPGMRTLEKYAVRTGGGENHRMNLADQILIKENHIALSGKSIKELVSEAAEKAHGLKIEIEVETLSQFEEALSTPADIIMLDNFSLEDMKKAIDLKNKNLSTALIEVSGGVDLDTIESIAETGPDRISVGRITNSARALDFSLLINYG